MRRWSRCVAAVLFLLSVAGLTVPESAQSQTKKAATQRKAGKLTAPVEAPQQEEAFDPSVYANGLPQGYRGVAPDELVGALDVLRAALRKDEYETTAQYEARRAELLARPLLRRIAETDLLAVSLNEPQVSRTYDADQGLMTIHMESMQSLGTILDPSDFMLQSSQIPLRGAFRVRDSTDTVFMNAYGAKWEGKKVYAEDAVLLVPSYVPLSVQFSLPQDVARSLRDSKLAVLLIGSLSSRDLVRSAISAKASVGNPDDLFVLSRACRLRPTQIWVYDVSTGRVLSRTVLNPPPLSKQGIDLGVERFLDDYVILAPSAFASTTDRKPVPGSFSFITTQSYKAKSSEPVPKVTITGVRVTGSAPDKSPPDLDAALAAFVKALEARAGVTLAEAKFGSAPVDGMPGKMVTGRVDAGPVKYSVASRSFVCPDVLRSPELCSVTATIDGTLDSAESELTRIIGSLAREKRLQGLPTDGKKKPLGVQMANVPAQAVALLGLPSSKGAMVVVVAGDSVASNAGLKPGDVVLEFDGVPVEGIEDLKKAVEAVPPGRLVKLRAFRAKQEVALTAQF